MRGVLVTWELLVHGKPPEVGASALDTLFVVELEAVAVEEWPGCKTGVGGESLGTERTQHGLDAVVKPGGNTATGKRGMSEKKVEVAVVRVGSEAREHSATTV